MKLSKKNKVLSGMLTALLIAFIVIPTAHACTRAVYLGENETVITRRTMDWAEDIQSNLWVFPRGMQRDGAAGPDSPKWISKYGSVIATAYDIATADGMNEAGLVINVLYLAESDYGNLDNKPPMSSTVWAQYVLDSFDKLSVV